MLSIELLVALSAQRPYTKVRDSYSVVPSVHPSQGVSFVHDGIDMAQYTDVSPFFSFLSIRSSIAFNSCSIVTGETTGAPVKKMHTDMINSQQMLA